MAITEVRSNGFAVNNTTVAQIVDLGLSINELARILGVYLEVEIQTAVISATARCELEYSFDPEDTTVVTTDDEHFARCLVRAAGGTQGGSNKQSEVLYKEFHDQNMLTSRNLSIIGRSDIANTNVAGKVFFEKFVPTANELNQLIARRR